MKFSMFFTRVARPVNTFAKCYKWTFLDFSRFIHRLCWFDCFIISKMLNIIRAIWWIVKMFWVGKHDNCCTLTTL